VCLWYGTGYNSGVLLDAYETTGMLICSFSAWASNPIGRSVGAEGAVRRCPRDGPRRRRDRSCRHNPPSRTGPERSGRGGAVVALAPARRAARRPRAHRLSSVESPGE
jgi:hypothetical protein